MELLIVTARVRERGHFTTASLTMQRAKAAADPGIANGIESAN